MNIIKIFSVFLVLMAVAFFTIPAQVEGRAVKLKIDYDEIWPTIWCLPENLYVTGTANVVVVYNEDAQGCIHWLIHVNGQQLNAVGVDTGQEYVVMFAGKDATGLPPDPYPQGKVCGDEPPYVFIFNFDVRTLRRSARGFPARR